MLLVYRELRVDGQIFTEATDDPEGIFALTDFDGIFGLGYRGISILEVTPVMYNLYSQAKVPRMAFSMYVNEIKGESYGRVLWGGSDERFYYPPFVYVPILTRGYFNVSMDKVRVGKGNKRS